MCAVELKNAHGSSKANRRKGDLTCGRFALVVALRTPAATTAGPRRSLAFSVLLALLMAALGCDQSGKPITVQITLQVTPASSTVVAGTTVQLHATATRSDGSQADFTGIVLWSTPPNGIYTVSSSGLVTTTTTQSGTGPAITASFGSASASATVTTTNGPIAIAPASPTVFSGTVLQLHASALVPGGPPLDVTNLVAWSTPANSIYSVSAGGLLATSATQTGTGPTITAGIQALSATTNASTTAGPDGLFVFRSPADNSGTVNFGNTVLVLTTSPRLGTLNPGNTFDS